jgi:predicted ABC-type ATPase
MLHCSRRSTTRGRSGSALTSRVCAKEQTELGAGRAARLDFAFETTLSGLTYVRRLQTWKEAGYRIEMVYLRLRSAQLALRRISGRVKQGGRDVPRRDVVRRFSRGWDNFQGIYRPLTDSWAVYDNSDREPRLLEKGP